MVPFAKVEVELPMTARLVVVAPVATKFVVKRLVEVLLVVVLRRSDGR